MKKFDHLSGLHGAGFLLDGKGMPRKGVDPVSWAVGGLVSILSTTSAVTAVGIGGLTAISQAIVGGALIGGALALSNSLGGNARQGVSDPGETKNTYEGEDGPRVFVFGRARVGGVWGFRATKGMDTYRWLLQCQGPIDGVEEYFIKDQLVTLDADGRVTSAPYDWGDGIPYLKLITKPGTVDQTVFDDLLTNFPQVFTENHRAREIMATLMRCRSPGVGTERYLKMWGAGLPTIDTLVRGPAWFDPRDNVERWSNNGILGPLHICTSPVEQGGWGMPREWFDMDDIAFQADMADTPVSSLSGSEVRSICSGSYKSDNALGSVTANMLLSTGTQVVKLDNDKYSIRLVDDNPTATTTLKKRFIKDIEWSGSELVSDANRLKLWFLSPERNWAMSEINISDKGWAKDAVSIARTRERTEELKLNFCPQSGQTQRIGRRYFDRMRQYKGAVVQGVAGVASLGHVAANAELEMMSKDRVSKVLLGRQKFNFNLKRVKTPFVMIDDLEEWDPNVHEAPAPVLLNDFDYTSEVGTPTIVPGSARVVNYNGTPEVRFAWTEVLDAVRYEANFRVITGSGNTEVSSLRYTMTEDDDRQWAYGTGVTLGQNLRLDVRAVPESQEPGRYSDPVNLVAAYDTTAPTGCTLRTETGEATGGIQPLRRSFTVYATSTDLNISKVESTFVRPHEEVVAHTESVSQIKPPGEDWQWPPDPTGTISFYNSTGQTTIVNY